VAEEKPSADSDLASSTSATGSSEASYEPPAVPRQFLGPSAETDSTAEPDGDDIGETPVVDEPTVVEPVTFDPPAPIEPVAMPEPPAPVAVAAPDLAGATEAPAVVAPSAVPAPVEATVVPPVEATVVPPVEATVVAPPAPPRKKKRGLLVGAIFGLIVVILLAAIGVLVYQRYFADPTRWAVAGECLADLPVVAVGEDKEVSRARMVPCTDPAATHVVEARINDKTEAQAKDPEVCAAFPTSTFIYRVVPPGGTGYVLCLKKVGQ
jgi:hypothetical protein